MIKAANANRNSFQKGVIARLKQGVPIYKKLNKMLHRRNQFTESFIIEIFTTARETYNPVQLSKLISLIRDKIRMDIPNSLRKEVIHDLCKLGGHEFAVLHLDSKDIESCRLILNSLYKEKNWNKLFMFLSLKSISSHFPEYVNTQKMFSLYDRIENKSELEFSRNDYYDFLARCIKNNNYRTGRSLVINSLISDFEKPGSLLLMEFKIAVMVGDIRLALQKYKNIPIYMLLNKNNRFLLNSFHDCLKQNKHFTSVSKVLKELDELEICTKTESSYNKLKLRLIERLLNFNKKGNISGSYKVWEQLLSYSISPPVSVYRSYLNLCIDRSKFSEAHKWILVLYNQMSFSKDRFEKLFVSYVSKKDFKTAYELLQIKKSLQIKHERRIYELYTLAHCGKNEEFNLEISKNLIPTHCIHEGFILIQYLLADNLEFYASQVLLHLLPFGKDRLLTVGACKIMDNMIQSGNKNGATNLFKLMKQYNLKYGDGRLSTYFSLCVKLDDLVSLEKRVINPIGVMKYVDDDTIKRYLDLIVVVGFSGISGKFVLDLYKVLLRRRIFQSTIGFVQYLCNNNCHNTAISLLMNIKNQSRVSDGFDVIIQYASSKGDLSLLRKVSESKKRQGLRSNVRNGNCVLNAYFRNAEFDKVEELFENFKLYFNSDPNIESYNLLLQMYNYEDETEKAELVFKKIIQQCLRPNVMTYQLIFSCLCGGRRFHQACNLFRRLRRDNDINSILLNVLLDISATYCCDPLFKLAFGVYKGGKMTLNVSGYTGIMKKIIQNNKIEMFIVLYREIKNRNDASLNSNVQLWNLMKRFAQKNSSLGVLSEIIDDIIKNEIYFKNISRLSNTSIYSTST